ncbi:L,D-transpeptidase [Peribacillus sp. NPDC060186]
MSTFLPSLFFFSEIYSTKLRIKCKRFVWRYYSIHGNNNEGSIGKYVSQGCVRMHNADVEKLYEKVQVGTPVAITYSYKSFVDLTKVYGYTFKSYKLKNN